MPTQEKTASPPTPTPVGTTHDGFRTIAIPEQVVASVKRVAEVAGKRFNYESPLPDGFLTMLVIEGAKQLVKEKLAALNLQAGRDDQAARKRIQGLAMEPADIGRLFLDIGNKWDVTRKPWRGLAEELAKLI